eukprot:4797092-Alexandrium_andersonii.AAC.1
MSASLVGSEMCIRDRPGTAPAWPSPNLAQPSLAQPQPGPATAWHSLSPVSYTHLTLPTICSV